MYDISPINTQFATMLEYAGTFIVSDGSLDRHSERVLPSGAVLDYFRDNPVMYYNHHRSTSADFAGVGATQIMPVGMWENVRIEDGVMLADAYIDTSDEVGQRLFRKVQMGVISSASIGFRALAWSDSDDDKLPGQQGYTITSWELLEISIVDIPSNRNASRITDEVRAFGQRSEQGDSAKGLPIFYKDFTNQKNTEMSMSDKFTQFLQAIGLKSSTEEEAKAEVAALKAAGNGELKKSLQDLQVVVDGLAEKVNATDVADELRGEIESVKAFADNFVSKTDVASMMEKLDGVEQMAKDIANQMMQKATTGTKTTSSPFVSYAPEADDEKARRIKEYNETLGQKS